MERNIEAVVIVEDDNRLRRDMCFLFSTMRGWEVWSTDRVRSLGEKKGVMELLGISNAYWLMLDLELADGDADQIISEIRQRWGLNIFITVVTGKGQRFPATQILGTGKNVEEGADLMFEKPYDVRALLQQITAQYNYQTGRIGKPTKSVVLRIGEYFVSIDSGVYWHVANHNEGGGSLADDAMRFLRTLAAARDDKGCWQSVARANMIMKVWGDKETESISARKHGERLRQLNLRLKRTFTVKKYGITGLAQTILQCFVYTRVLLLLILLRQ